VEVLNEIYLAVTLESTVVWPKHGYGKRKSDLVAVDKCLARSPDMKVNVMGNNYQSCIGMPED
jgi:hypothetical protein